MKHIKIVCLILAVCLLFSGCSFRLASSIDDLISPISPFGENADVQKAMDSFVKSGYSLKTPTHGNYIASYTFIDLDGDNQEEAVSFYEPTTNLGTTFMAVLKIIDGNWSVVCNVDGFGKDIYSLDFCDINGDSKNEIIACWDVISNSSSHNLAAYYYNDNEGDISVTCVDNYISVNNYVCVDFNSDASEEILAFVINSSNSAKAQLYSLTDGSFVLMGETKLDSNVTDYVSICSDNIEGDVRVYADAIKSNGSSMVTELIYWSDSYGTIVSPFYNYSTGLTKGTTRNAMATCRDLDGDGEVEIPKDAYIENLPWQVQAIDWKIYKNTVLQSSNYSLFVPGDKYLLIIPDDYFENIAVTYDETTRCLTVSEKSTNSVMFSVVPVLKSLYNENQYKDYEIILDHSGYYYLATSGENSVIDTQQLKDLIKSY